MRAGRRPSVAEGYGKGTSHFVRVDLAGSKFGPGMRSIELEFDGGCYPDSARLRETLARRYGVPINQVGAVLDIPAEIEELQDELEEATARATFYEQEAGQAYRNLLELVEQFADIERGIRTIDEVLELGRQLPTTPEVFQW
jgi:hypothetical protein